MKGGSGCIEGLACPGCTQHRSFIITATTLATVDKHGVREHADMEWGDSSRIVCPDCKRVGTVEEFTLPEGRS